MKKLLLILFTIVSVSVQAQYLKPNNSYGLTLNRLNPDSTLLVPTGCGDPSLRGVDLKKVALYGDTCNNLLYKYNPKTTTWNVIGSGTGMDTAFYSSSATADTIIGLKGNNRFVIGIIYNKDGLISGGIVTWDSLLTFDATAAVYRKNAVVYNSPAGSITLDAADPTYNRIDLIVLDTTGNIRKVTGVPSANPAVPQIDPTYGIILTQVQVNANATTPANVSSSVVYDENTEFTTSAVNATVNFDNTVNPFHLTKAADVTAASSGGYLQFVSSTVLNATDYNTIKFYIRLKTALAKKTSISVIFYDGSINVSNGMVLSSTNGFDPTITGTYQNISIPMSDFNFSPSAFDRIRIVFNGSSFSSFYIDYVQLQAGVTNAQDLNFVRNVYASGGNLYQNINGQNQLITTIGSGIDSSAYSSVGTLNDSTWFLNNKNGIKQFFQLTQGTVGVVGDTVKFTNPAFVKKTDKFPIGTIKPILALNDSTLAFDSLNLTEIRYSLAARDTTQWTDTTLIDKQFLQDRISTITATGITRTELQDTAAAIRGSIPASSGSTLNGTGYVQMSGTTPSYVTSPVDSAAYHTASVYQDTTLILQRPNGINDSISFHIGIPQSGWLLGGNIGTKSDSNFIGTKDTAALSFRVNNVLSGRIDSINATSGKTLFGFGVAPLATENDATAFGFKALNSLTNGGFPTYYGNTAIGTEALYSVTTTGYNTAVGYNALKLSTGTSNTALGFLALSTAPGASNNTALGRSAMQTQQSSNNTAVGYLAMGSGSGIGGSNTAVGVLSLGSSTINGSSNSAFGYSAGGLNASGSNNLYLGFYAGYNNTASNSIFVSSIGSRGSLLNDQTQSPIYVVQSAINNYSGTAQSITLNGKVGNNTISPTAWWNLSRGDGVTAPLKFEPPLTIAATGGSSTSTFFTINFATQTNYPFVWGTQVTLSGFTPSTYNGTWTIANGTTSSITVSSALNPGTVTVNGTITQGGLKPTPVSGEVENDSTSLYYSSGTGSNFSRSAIIKGKSGTATLAAGTVTVSTTFIKANSRVLVSVATPSGTQGFLSAPTASIVAGTSFVINSTSATETSTVNWLIINP